jgi:hypothetical protein
MNSGLIAGVAGGLARQDASGPNATQMAMMSSE